MSDERHKRPPPKVKGEPVTELFCKQVEAALRVNDATNTQYGFRKGDPGYKIANHADLADAVGCVQNTIINLLGGVRSGTKSKGTGVSKYVPLIRAKLNIPQMVNIEVRADRAALLQRINNLSADLMATFAAKLSELEAKLPRDPR